MNQNKPVKPFLFKSTRSTSSFLLPSINPNTGASNSITFFQYNSADFLYDLQKCPLERLDNDNNYKNRLINAWEKAKQNNVFNYDLNVMYKLLDGNYNLSLQLNTERGSLRRKPMPFRHIKEPFNHLRWNFTKLQPNEILFYLKCNDIPYTDDPVDTHIIAINASPLEKDHILIIPSISRCLPQVLTDVTTRIATDLMLLVEDEKFHILFNSLLGYASVNHLHLHGVFWPYDSDLINRKFQRLWEEVYFIRRPNWFIDILAFQLKHQHDFEGFIRNFTNCVNFLNALNMAHNIFFTRAPPICSDNNVLNEENIPLIVTAYLIPRKSVAGAKPPLNFNPAALELVGCLTSSTFHFFDTITEHNAVRIVEEDSVLEEKFVDKLLKEIESRLKCEKLWNSGLNDIVDDNIERNMLTSHELEELNDSFQ